MHRVYSDRSSANKTCNQTPVIKLNLFVYSLARQIFEGPPPRVSLLVQASKEVEYAKCEDRILLIVLNSEKLADYNSGCCQEVRWSIYFLYPPPLDIK